MRTIEEDDAERIARAFDEGRDPLRLGDRYETVLTEHVLQHAEDLLSGSVRLPAETPKLELDLIARALLVHEGADPDAVAAIALQAMGAGIVDEDGERIAIIELRRGDDLKPYVRRMAVHSGALSWYQDRTLEVRETLPETVQIAVAGLPLARVVSHPALDPLALVIERVDGRLIRIAP